MKKAPKGKGTMPLRKSTYPAGRFLLLFSLLLAAYYVVILLPWSNQALAGYLRANAWVSHVLLRGLGQVTELQDVTIRSGSFAISIRRGCDAVEPAWFFCAAVLAFPVAWRRKPVVLAAGTAAILLLNLVRIVTLFFIGRFLPGFFATAHLELWPAVFILVAAGLWLWWIRGVSESPITLPDART